MIRALVCMVLAALALAPPATAHTRSQSLSHWNVDGDVVVGRVEADALDATRLYATGGEAPLEETFRREVDSAFSVSTSGGACVAAEPALLTPASRGRLAALVRFQCRHGTGGDRIRIASRLFLGVAASHLHFVAVSRADGAEADAVLTDTHRDAWFELRPESKPESALSTFLRYVPVGAQHVWSGLDHIAFILGLTLLAGRLGPVVVAASGFTIGHTLTLLMAALGVIQPHAPTVEALIGFTVAFVALEGAPDGRERLSRWSIPLAAALAAMAALAAATSIVVVSALSLLGLAIFVFAFPRGFPRGAGAAPWLAAAFGLVHGCGFAGALGRLDLPRPRLLAALGGFNIGVELAQIVVIGAALSVGILWRRYGAARLAFAPALTAAALFGLGLYWFASRALALSGVG